MQVLGRKMRQQQSGAWLIGLDVIGVTWYSEAGKMLTMPNLDLGTIRTCVAFKISSASYILGGFWVRHVEWHRASSSIFMDSEHGRPPTGV